MKTIIGLLIASQLVHFAAQADVLSPRAADAICHQKALAAAHFIAETKRPFMVSYRASEQAEIATPIAYSFTYPGMTETLYVVQAYAYPDDGTCTIGVIRNLIAGND